MMTEPERILPAEEIEARAADFLHRRRVQRWREGDQAELDAWLEESTLHRVAFLRLEESEAHIEQLADLESRDLDRLRPRRRRSFALPLLAIAASLGLFAVTGVAAWNYFLQQPADRVFGTNVGGRALLKFVDGTEIELNTNTAVRYRMTTRERTVWLDRGEAFFRVAHNAANPFAVVVGGHRITDLGTEFLVRDEPGSLSVALVEGRAQLASDNAATPIAMLVPGEEAVATPHSTTITKRTPQEIADELAWRRGILVFRNTTLADAVREFNRYNDSKLVIADPSIAGMRLSVEIKDDNFDGFIQIAETVLKLRVDREGNDFLISRNQKTEIRSRKSEAKSRVEDRK